MGNKTNDLNEIFKKFINVEYIEFIYVNIQESREI